MTARTHDRHDRGFTLVELLVVVVVIAALAAIAIPVTIDQRRAAVDAQTTSDVRNLGAWQAIITEQMGTGANWSTGNPLPVTLAGYQPSEDTILVASSGTGGWCVTGWNPAGRHDAADDPLWMDSTSRAVRTSKPATAACDALAPVIATPTPLPTSGAVGGTFTKAVYAAGSVSFTNAWTIAGIDADLYVGGNFDCNSNVRVMGKVFVIGNAYMTNSCQIDGDLWVGGTLTMDSSSKVLGDTLAVGNVRMTTQARVGGDLTTNGTVALSGSPYVGGTLRARGAVSIANANSQQVGEDIRTEATFSSNRDFKGRAFVENIVVGGRIYERVTNGVTVDPPPPVLLPPAPYIPSQWTGFQFQTWAQWLNANAAANNAPSWSTARTSAPGCTAAGANYSLSGPLTITQDTVIDARQVSSGCSKVTLQGLTLKLSADLVIYADSLETVSGFKAESGDGSTHVLRIIVPGLTPECGSGRDVIFGNGTQLDEEVQTLLYSPSRVHLAGATAMWGQIVSGCVSSDGQTTINYLPVAFPGWGG